MEMVFPLFNVCTNNIFGGNKFSYFLFFVYIVRTNVCALAHPFHITHSLLLLFLFHSSFFFLSQQLNINCNMQQLYIKILERTQLNREFWMCACDSKQKPTWREFALYPRANNKLNKQSIHSWMMLLACVRWVRFS